MKDIEMAHSSLERIRSKWHLDKKNGWVAGVCAGLANYFHTDPAFVRVGLVISALFLWKIVLGAYVIAWILLNDQQD